MSPILERMRCAPSRTFFYAPRAVVVRSGKESHLHVDTLVYSELIVPLQRRHD